MTPDRNLGHPGFFFSLLRLRSSPGDRAATAGAGRAAPRSAVAFRGRHVRPGLCLAVFIFQSRSLRFSVIMFASFFTPAWGWNILPPKECPKMHLPKGSLSLNLSPLQQPGWLHSEQIPLVGRVSPLYSIGTFFPTFSCLVFLVH